MKIHPILNKIKEPFITVDYYKKSIDKPFLSSFGILSTVIILMATLRGVQFVNTEVPKFIKTVQETISQVSQNYPDDLIFDWNGKKLVSSAEKLSIPWPNSLQSDFSENSSSDLALPEEFLFYHNSNQTPEQLNISTNEYMVVVNSANIYNVNEKNPNTWATQSLMNLIKIDESLNLNKDSIMSFTTQAQNFISNNIINIKIAFLASFSIIFIISKYWFLVIETVLVILLFKLYSLKLTHKQIVLLTTHVMIPTVVLNTFAELIYTNISFPLQTLTFWILIMFISFQFRRDVKKIKN